VYSQLTEREKGETFALMARANGRGRLIPTPALSKIMLHRAAGGLGGPLLKTVHCIYIMNPQQSQSQSQSNQILILILTLLILNEELRLAERTRIGTAAGLARRSYHS